MPAINENAQLQIIKQAGGVALERPQHIEFVKNFDRVRNSPVNLTSQQMPALTLLSPGESKSLFFYSDRGDAVQVRNGAIYNAVIGTEVIEKHSQDRIPAGRSFIKDGALSFGLNRFRITEGQETETQKILSELKDVKDEGARRAKLLALVGDKKFRGTPNEVKLKMVNDPVRRAFESYYAKYALQAYFSDAKKYKKFSDISNAQVKYIKDNYVSSELFRKYDAAWRNEKFDTTIVGLDQLKGFYGRAVKILETLDISAAAQEALFDIYKHRYLSYALKNEPDVEAKLPEGHWDGVFDPIKSPGKGRVELSVKEGNLFRQTGSHNVGIMRSIDPTPRDLQLKDLFSTQYEKDYKGTLLAGASTRCPDRLEMQSPNHPDALKPNSYMAKLFEAGTGTYVNGPSGSILIEHGAVRACKDIHANTSAKDIEAYLEVQALLFIYVDGGHSMDEISYALMQGNAQEKMHVALGGKEGLNKVGVEMFKNIEVLSRAAKDASVFNDALKVKDASHEKILHTNPAGVLSGSAKTRELAELQSLSARNTLYHPGDALLNELSGAANVLHKVVSRLSPENQLTMGAHVLGEGRLLAGKTPSDVLAALERVSSGGATASGKDRAVVIALMGDIGGFYTTPHNSTPELMAELNFQLKELGLYVPTSSDIQIMREMGGSGAVGPDKRNERKISNFDSRADIPLRAGIHNTGLAADKTLNIAPEHRIPENRWAVFDISRSRVKEATEPFVGHMSASPAEILQTWDMLRGVKGGDQYAGALIQKSAHQNESFSHPLAGLTSGEQQQRYARAAGASAFLVGLGYHSAVEVLEGVLTYLGQSIRGEGTLSALQRDSGHLFGHGAATDLMAELFKANTLSS